MEGVTGSIPVAPTIQSGFLSSYRDVRRVPANGGLFYSPVESLVFPTEKPTGLGTLSPAAKFPFLASEKCAQPIFSLWVQIIGRRLVHN